MEISFSEVFLLFFIKLYLKMNKKNCLLFRGAGGEGLILENTPPHVCPCHNKIYKNVI